MMRKDVKLGFAIGGVLLAVLVVYVLVGTGNSDDSRNGAGIVTEDTAGGKVSPGKVVDSGPPKLPDSSILNNVGSIVGNTSGRDLPRGSLTSPPDRVAANDAVGKASDPNQDLWNSALNQGQLLISKTPDAPGNIPGGANDPNQPPPRATPASGENITGMASNTGTPVNNSGSVDPTAAARANEVAGSAPGGSIDASTSGSLASPATQPTEKHLPTSVGQREHIVRPGETLSLIAQAAYGNANLYPAILRANPNLDPKRMRPGMTIILPATSDVNPDVKPVGSNTAGGSVPVEINSKSVYRVQSNDSLYRIAMKLYGKPDMVAKIYELNKETIGSDPGKLKLNMLLKLPEPPTQAASR